MIVVFGRKTVLKQVRAKHEAEADAEFQQFFGQVMAKNNEQN